MKKISEIKKYSKLEDPLLPKYYQVYRWLSWYVTGLVCDIKFITPDITTLLSYLFTAIGCVMMMLLPGYQKLWSLPFFVLKEVCDRIDGALARYRKIVSMGGKFLDSIGHSVVPGMFLTSIAVAAFFQTADSVFVWLALMIGFFYMAGHDAQGRRNFILYTYKVIEGEYHDAPSLISKIGGFPTLYCTEITMLAILFNKLDWLTWFYATFICLRYFAVLFFYQRSLNKSQKKNNIRGVE